MFMGNMRYPKDRLGSFDKNIRGFRPHLGPHILEIPRQQLVFVEEGEIIHI